MSTTIPEGQQHLALEAIPLGTVIRITAAHGGEYTGPLTIASSTTLRATCVETKRSVVEWKVPRLSARECRSASGDHSRGGL